jgi:hypothetical protein
MNNMMMKKPRGIKDGVFTEDSGMPPPQDIDGGSAPKPKKPKKYAKGGSVTRAEKDNTAVLTTRHAPARGSLWKTQTRQGQR